MTVTMSLLMSIALPMSRCPCLCNDQCPFSSLMSMPMQHVFVDAACSRQCSMSISRLYFHVSTTFPCPCCISLSVLCVHAPCPCTCCMSVQHEHAACTGYMSMLRVHVSMLQVHLYVHADFSCCISVLHVRATYPCSMSCCK